MPRDKRLAGVLVALAIGLVACGSSGGSSTTPANTGGATTGGDTTTGEAAAVAYVDARYHYRIDAPGRMTANADGTAAVVGPSERLQVAVVQGAKAADLAALAREDAAALPSSSPDFRLMSGPGLATVNGHRWQKFVYSWTAGTSQVTGKPVTLIGVRYYVPKDAATVAVITYGIVSNQYDPQGADDVASTFLWQ